MNNKKYLFLAVLCLFFEQSYAAKIKPWTMLIYIAADNDLSIFKDQNINQMKKIGSTNNINIVLCVNSSDTKYNTKTSQIIFIEKNNARILKSTSAPQATDSGNPENLINFCKYALEKFPAEKNALIFWNHGTGALDPFKANRLTSSDLFLFDIEKETPTCPEFLSSISIKEPSIDSFKAICFDDSTGNFLTEKKLSYALKKICSQFLNGKTFNIIGFDACLMAMIETASFLKDFGDLLVSSQEVELGAGWDYKKVLTPFLQENLSPEEFGQHIVDCYAKTYRFIDDFTLSCINLKKISFIEENVSDLANFLHTKLMQQDKTFFFNLIKQSRYKHVCTHFDEPDYIDLLHFYKNMLHNSLNTTKSNTSHLDIQKQRLEGILREGIYFMQQSIVANKTGSFFPDAAGLSIYFPEYSIHRSYKNNSFATKTLWFPFLKSYFF